MLTWLVDNVILFSALVVTASALLAVLVLPSRKNMMLKHTCAPRRRIKFSYTMALVSFIYVSFLALVFMGWPDIFKGIVGSLFVYSNSALLIGIGVVLTAETRWVSRFSRELEMKNASKGTSVTVVSTATVESRVGSAVDLLCPICHNELTVPHELLGHIITCPSCGTEGRIGGGGS